VRLPATKKASTANPYYLWKRSDFAERLNAAYKANRMPNVSSEAWTQ